MKLTITKRSGKVLDSLDLPGTATVADLKDEFYKIYHYYPERQWFNVDSAKGPALKDGTLVENGLTDGSVVVFKDLGVQISWRLVFVIEYLGPILIFPLFAWAPGLLYQTHETVERSLTQKVALWLVLFHFVKREVETLFVHRFSSQTMPIQRLPINCFHYWVLCALSVGFFLFHPQYQEPIKSPVVIYCLAAIMIVFEIFNFQTHLVLRSLRPRGTKCRGIPEGWGFQWVSCANYFWESLAWITYAFLTGCFTAWVFVVIAFGQMAIWSLKKHRNYRNEFKEYPRSRRAIVPLLL